jgi:hypothetical protein
MLALSINKIPWSAAMKISPFDENTAVLFLETRLIEGKDPPNAPTNRMT